MYRAEHQQLFSYGDNVVEVSFLSVSFARENQQRSYSYGRHVPNVGCAFSTADPRLIFLEKIPHRGMMGRFIGLEVQIEGDQGPVSVVAIPQSLLHQWTNALKEVLPHGRLVAVDGFPVGHKRPRLMRVRIGVPEQILFNGHRCSGAERALNSVGPLSGIRITIVSVHHHPRSGMDCRGNGRLPPGQHTDSDEQKSRKPRCDGLHLVWSFRVWVEG